MTTRRKFGMGIAAMLAAQRAPAALIRSLIAGRHIAATGTRLPYDAEVEYLESTGTQWISIGMTFDETFKMEMDFKYDTISTGATCHGQNGSSGSLYSRFTFGKGAASWDDWYCGLGDLNYRTNIHLDTQRHTFVVDAINKEFKIDDSTYTVNYTRFTHLQNPYSASLFCRTTIDIGSQDPLKIIGRIFACKIWRSGVLVRDFIPVRFTNELGQSEGAMYDRVSGQLFRNQGTGAFVIGPVKARGASGQNGGGISG